jgi:CxxC motif-containing protein (DUF1111 family)
MKPWIAILAITLAACNGSGSDPAPAPPGVPAAQLGGPNPNLTAAQLTAFNAGKLVFERRFKRSEGHGPDFNVFSCRSCHEIPVTGGSSPLYRNFSIVADLDVTGTALVPILDDGQLVSRSFSYTRVAREAIPATAQVVAQRNAPPMFGVGLLGTIPPTDISANQDPNDTNPADGISGRANFEGTLLSRFGFKAQSASLIDFVRGPLFNHMGITTDPLLVAPPQLRGAAQVSNPGAGTTDNDGVPDPEISQQGEQVFNTIGCAKCHIPNIVTQGDPIFAYTDLLLHEMGAGLDDGVFFGLATSSEFRTAPLWGLRHHAPFLHDGSADTISDAVLAHGGEAQSARNAFDTLGAADLAAILAFLESL